MTVEQDEVHWDTGRASQHYVLYDVSTDAATLDNTAGTNAAIYADLGSGLSYGNADLAVANGVSQGNVDIDLNANGLNDLNNALAGGADFFSIGGTINGEVAAVPEPASLTLFAVAAASMAGYASAAAC